MLHGKKSTAYSLFYDAIEIVDKRKQNEEKTAVEVWKDALSNVMPHVEVRVEGLVVQLFKYQCK